MKSCQRPVILIAMSAKKLIISLIFASLLSGCVVPHQSVVVETNSNGVPVHASGPMSANHYTVVRGDTLYSIAFRAGVDYHDLAHWNGIPSPYVIHPGRTLRLTPKPHPVGVPSQPVFKPVTPHPHTPPKPVVPTPPMHHTAQVADAESTTIPVAGEVTPQSKPPVSARSVPNAPSHRVDGVTWRWPADGTVVSGFKANDAIPGIEIAGHAGDPVRAAADGVVVYSGNGLVGYGELIIIKHNSTYLSAYGHNRKRLVHEGERVRAGQVIAKMGSSGAPRNELEFQVRKKGKPVDPQHYLPPR